MKDELIEQIAELIRREDLWTDPSKKKRADIVASEIADIRKAHYIGNEVDILPCDVKLQDGVTVRKGCAVDTLITALRNRDKFNKQHE